MYKQCIRVYRNETRDVFDDGRARGIDGLADALPKPTNTAAIGVPYIQDTTRMSTTCTEWAYEQPTASRNSSTSATPTTIRSTRSTYASARIRWPPAAPLKGLRPRYMGNRHPLERLGSFS